MMRNKDFVAFILTHGRADNVITYNTLRNHGYTGRIVLIIDDEDTQKDEYIKRYRKKNVFIFSKAEERKLTDSMDCFPKMNCILYARNVCFRAAKELGYRYFIELDDDYTTFHHRYHNFQFKSKVTRNLDNVFDLFVDFLRETPALTIAMAQGGDFLGGGTGNTGKRVFLKRKAMNTFFCDTEKPFRFIGKINEDVNTYTSLGKKGQLFFTHNMFAIVQKTTQKNKGGMTDLYLDVGTYIKSIYSIIDCPTAVEITLMGTVARRIHHNVKWKYAVPKIMNERWRKSV